MSAARRRLARDLYLGFTGLSLAGAAVAGVMFAAKPMDMVLLQLTFYGAWSCLFGARVGGYLGAMMEEDCCSDLDMGVLSSMGSMLGTLSAGLVGTALVGLGLSFPWLGVLAAFVVFAGAHVLVGRLFPLRVARLPHLDERGRSLDASGAPLPPDRQPLRMPDRVGALLAASAAVMLVLTLGMAWRMGGDLGHPVMMAPMMYGMFGTMLGGMLGGWLAGLLDEHQGHPDHDNPVMVGAMALMAGMMGGMPSGMIGGMLAIMGVPAIGASVAGGLLLAGLSWACVMRGRYRVARAEPAPAAVPRSPPPARPEGESGFAVLLVRGMSCEACRAKVTRKVGELPGVHTVDVDVEGGRVYVAWSGPFAGLDVVSERIVRLGYTVTGAG